MKRTIIKYIYIAFSFVLIGLAQGCVKESFEGDNMGDAGTTFLKTPDGDVVVHWLTPFDNVQKVNLFTLFKAAHNKAELNGVNVVKIKMDNSIVDEYNEENETDFEVLPSDFYTIAQGDGITGTASELSIEFGNGRMYGVPALNIDGSKWTDLAQKYAVAFVITDYGNIEPSAALTDTIIVQLGLKNQWDGIYVWTGTLTDNASGTIEHIATPYADAGYGDYEIQLVTIGETKVAMFDDILWGDYMYPMYSGGWSGYGSFAPVFEFDPETNEVISVTNYYGQPAGNTRYAELDPSGENYYNPDTKVLKVKYFMFQPNTVPSGPRSIMDEEFRFLKGR